MALTLLLAGCTASDSTPPQPWNGRVQTHGALRSIFHEGQTGAMVSLDSVLPNPNLYALGALPDLAGEVTVIAGQVYLALSQDDTTEHTETATESNAGATLLVSAEVPSWQSTVTKDPINFEALDQAIAQLAADAGMDLDSRFPFLLEGTFNNLEWHVIDGSRLADGGTSHQDHLAASVHLKQKRAAATLIGFYSNHDQGVFTHMGSATHIHCVVHDGNSAGHVDHVEIPVGTTIKFPVVQW